MLLVSNFVIFLWFIFVIQEFPCPVCRNPVKKVTLSTRTLDDVQCEKDTSWRRRVMKVFNKVESDFATLAQYNDYLEEKEDIIFSIVNEGSFVP